MHPVDSSRAKEAKRAIAASTPSGSAMPTPSGGAGGGAPGDDTTLTDWGAQVANTSHLSNLTVTPDMAGVEDLIFQNTSCVLSPEGEIGPYCKFRSCLRFSSKKADSLKRCSR